MNNSANNTGLPPYLLDPEFQLAEGIRSVYIWVLVAVGLPTNAACLVTVFFMHVTTATFYVAFLAVADSLSLIVKLIYHQTSISSASVCYSQGINNFCSCYANWVLLLITFQRFFAVCFPLKIKVAFTKVKIYTSVVVLAVGLFAVIFIPSILLREWEESTGDCIEMDEMKNFTAFLSIMYFIIPFVLISVFTALTILGLRRHQRARQEIQSGYGSAGGSSAERAISIMLVCAAVVFLVLALPSCVYFLQDPPKSIRTYLIYQVVVLLADSNHAVNFFVYFISASRFRDRFIGLMCRLANFVTRGRCKHRHDINDMGDVSSDVMTERTHMASLN